jgi:streptogramin lyase
MRDLAIDTSGNVWVPNSFNGTVAQLDSSANLLNTYNVISSPHDIAIDASGNVWLSSERQLIKIVGVAKGPQFFPYRGPVWPY